MNDLNVNMVDEAACVDSHEVDLDEVRREREREQLGKELAAARRSLAELSSLAEAQAIEIGVLKQRVIDPMELATLRGLAAQAARSSQIEARLETALTEKQATVAVAQLLEARVDEAHEKLDYQSARMRCVLAAVRDLIDACEPTPAELTRPISESDI